jgi:zinc protease
VRSTNTLGALLAMVSVCGEAHADPPVSATRYALPNGLDVLLAPDPTRGQVVVRMDYDAGLAHDPEGYPETAHLVEHLLFRGTRHTHGSTTHRLRAFGIARANGFTQAERTAYVTSATSSQLSRVLWLEGDRLAFGLDAMTEGNVERERAIVWREHVERVGLSPFTAANALLLQALFPPGQPLRTEALGVTDPDALRLDAARWFFQQWYAPGNAHLTVVGGFDPEAARAAIAQSFGDIPARAVPRPRDVDAAEPREGAPDIEVEARVDHARLAIGWRTPAHRAPGDAELDVFRRFFATAVEEALLAARQVVTGVVARQFSAASGSRFVLTVDLGIGGVTDHVRGYVLRAVTNALRRCETDGWFEAARETELAGYRTPPTSLTELAEDLARDRDPDDPGGYVRDLARFTALDRAGTCTAVRRLLAPGRGVMLHVNQADDAPLPYRPRSPR